MNSPALRSRLSLPAGDATFVQIEGDDDSLERAAVGQQRQNRNHQPLRLVRPIQSGVFSLGEGPSAAFALVATLLLTGVDHDVPLTGEAVGAAAGVVAPFVVRVHADSPR